MMRAGHLGWSFLAILLQMTYFAVQAQVRPTTPAPVTDVSNACATVDCIQGSECRIVHPCPTCEPTVTCVPTAHLDEDVDDECERQQYLQTLLIDTSGTPCLYSPLKCRGPLATRDCPQGSACVDDLRGGGTCCTGKPDPVDQCGGCPAGEVCVLRSPVCPPGRYCIQAPLPTCVPEGCETCRADQDCIKASHQPVCAVGQPCPIRHTCADKDRCGPTPCPPGQQCNFVGTICADPAPGTPPDPNIFGCFDQYECQAVSPEPVEPVCGLRCPPTHRCTFVRPGCVPGGLCSITPFPTCVRVAPQEPPRNRRCPRPSRRYNPSFRVCRRELTRFTSCGRDSDCYGNKICCTSKCGNRVCMPSRPYY